jgi:hypothetical protein
MKPGDEPPLLTFQWRVRDRPLARLILFLFLTIVGAAGFFLLFKVVYPQARRFSTAPQQVLVLDPAQAATRDIVNRTSDENFLLLSPDSDPARAGDEARELFPVFRPSFAGAEMKLMDLPGEQDEKTLPRVYRIDDMPMPPLATVMKARPPGANVTPTGPAVLRVVLHGDLSKRELSSSRDISGIALADPISPRFRICVNNTGLVIFALPLESSVDAKQMRALHHSLSMLRFKPVKSPATQWGEVSFAWETPKP